ncbi:MAG: competence protein ComJ [Pseudomonadota bacterium]
MPTVDLSVAYGQVCIFDPALEAPYNDWTQDHVAQGFSWRSGSVSFAVADGVEARLSVTISDVEPRIPEGVQAIRVPFDVPTSGQIEVGTVMAGEIVAAPSGAYALYFIDHGEGAGLFEVVLQPASGVAPAVLQGGETFRMRDRYLMDAKPA